MQSMSSVILDELENIIYENLPTDVTVANVSTNSNSGRLYVYKEGYVYLCHVLYDIRNDNCYLRIMVENSDVTEGEEGKFEYYCNLYKLFNWFQESLVKLSE